MGEKRYMISDAAKKVNVEPHVLRYWEDEIGIEIPRNEMGHRYYRKEDILLLRSVRDLKEKGFQLKAIKLLLPDLPRIESLDSERLIDLRNRLDLALGTENPESADKEALTSGAYSEEADRSVTANEDISAVKSAENEAINAPSSSGQEADAEAACAMTAVISSTQELPSSEEKLLQFRSIMNDIVSTAVQGNNRQLIEEMNQCLTESVTREVDMLLRLREEREEERFRGIDRIIREHQTGRSQSVTVHENYGTISRRRDSKFFKKHKVRI